MKKSTQDLIAAAYGINEEEEYWGIISELHSRGSESEFLAAINLVNSEDPINREIGADILGQLGWREDAFGDESVSLLIPLLSDDCDDVVGSAAYSLGHRRSYQAIPYLIAVASHRSSRVRNGVAFGLLGLESEEAVATLITLSRDMDVDVRNWATFGVAQSELDNNDVRVALKARIADEDPDVRGEAFIGLACRGVSEVSDALVRELAGEFHGNWAIEAASVLADPACCRALIELKERESGHIEERFMADIEEAVSRCCVDHETGGND